MTESEFEAEFERSVAPYRSSPGSNQFQDGSVIRSLNDAVAHLRKSLGEEFDLDITRVIESKDWWYIPFVWIGCRGYIVDKLNGYINQLGSCHPLDLCFWAHERNIKYVYSDLTVTRINNLPATIATLKRMGNRSPINPIPNKSGPTLCPHSQK